MIYSEPNKFAEPYKLSKEQNVLRVRGYHNYDIFDDRVDILDPGNTEKFKMVVPYINKCNGMSVLDIGSGGGLYSLLARCSGARTITSVEMDKVYADGFQEVVKAIKAKNIEVHNNRITEREYKAEMVIALAMIHWMYSCTELFGSLDKVISYLRSLTNNVLLTEWIAPDDPAVVSFKHTGYNPEVKKAEYSKENFDEAMLANFGKVEYVGDLTQTRGIYLGYTHLGVEGHGATSQIFINRKNKVVGKTKIREYDFDTHANEVKWLLRVKGCDRFPNIIHNTEATILMSYEGEPLTKKNLPKDWRGQCQLILQRLRQNNCSHNDIKPSDLLVKDKTIKLIDFGWATEMDEKLPDSFPKDLGIPYRYSEDKTNDAYSLFKSVEDIYENSNRNTVL
tara:strand:- start:5544 stop:6725 length:1182 start_codon:yes stop_codon:yes gene_type:complete